MRGDGLHLTNESAEIMADYITRTILDQLDQQTENDNIEVIIQASDTEMMDLDNDLATEEIETTKEIAAKIIGAGGERIRKIKALHNVEIKTIDAGQNQRTFTIKGQPKDAIKALKTIQAITRDIEEKDSATSRRAKYTNALQETVKKIPETCRYYARGSCNRGESCWFIHQQGPTDLPDDSETTTSTSEEEEREPTPVREVTLTSKAAKGTTRKKRDDRHRTPPGASGSQHKRSTTPCMRTPSKKTRSTQPTTDNRHRKRTPSRTENKHSSHHHHSRSSSGTPRTHPERKQRRTESPSPQRRTPTKGQKGKCSNERGITLASNVGKVYERIINERVKKDVNITKAQAGGKPGCSTVDHLIALKQTIKEIRNKGLTAYMIFLDVQKAYDKAWLDAISYALNNNGIQGKNLRKIKKLNSNLTAKIQIRFGLTRKIKIRDSVRQGVVLSVIEYATLIDEIAKELKHQKLGYETTANITLDSLLWMDDVCLIHHDLKKLQEILDVTNHVANKCHIQFGVAKCKVIKIGRGKKITLKLKGEILEEVPTYKYLGEIINNKVT